MFAARLEGRSSAEVEVRRSRDAPARRWTGRSVGAVARAADPVFAPGIVHPAGMLARLARSGGTKATTEDRPR